jgi:DNA repair protein SbcD/Mre11
VATQTPTPDLADRVRALLPQATLLDVHDDCAATRVEVVGGTPTGAEPTLQELFADFLAQSPRPGVQASQVRGVFDTLLEAAEAQTAAHFDEEALLEVELAAVGDRQP